MTKRDDISELFFQEAKTIARALDDRDDMRGYVLRIHLLTEALMEQCMRIAIGTEVAGAVLSAELTYDRKLTICSRLNLDDGNALFSSDTIGSMRKLNGLRNELAHSLMANVTAEKVENLFVGQMKAKRSKEVVEGDASIKLRAYSAAILDMLGEPAA